MNFSWTTVSFIEQEQWINRRYRKYIVNACKRLNAFILEIIFSKLAIIVRQDGMIIIDRLRFQIVLASCMWQFYLVSQQTARD